MLHHRLQHARPPCPSPFPGAWSNLCPSSWRCHPTISSSVIPFSSCLQSFPASGSFLCIRWPKYWSFSFGISPSNDYSGLISFRIDLREYKSSYLNKNEQLRIIRYMRRSPRLNTHTPNQNTNSIKEL